MLLSGEAGIGKSTLLEAIAWAIYGTPAVRGSRDGIRFHRASAAEEQDAIQSFGGWKGSGSTGKACMREGFKFIGVEMQEDYFAIAQARIAHAAAQVAESEKAA